MWYQIVSAIVNVGLAWNDQYLSNRINKKMLNTAAKTAEFTAKMKDLAYGRRTSYRNEELSHQVWNTVKSGVEMLGAQAAAISSSGFGISTGDIRLMADTVYKFTDKTRGMVRTYQIQQYEDSLQTANDIMQYNFEAYANRQMAKQYTGIRGFAKIVDAGGRAFVNSASSNLFSNPMGGTSSNTGSTGLPSGWLQGISQQKGSNGALGSFGGLSLSNSSNNFGINASNFAGAGSKKNIPIGWNF